VSQLGGEIGQAGVQVNASHTLLSGKYEVVGILSIRAKRTGFAAALQGGLPKSNARSTFPVPRLECRDDERANGRILASSALAQSFVQIVRNIDGGADAHATIMRHAPQLD
jgi:hypothetical protein